MLERRRLLTYECQECGDTQTFHAFSASGHPKLLQRSLRHQALHSGWWLGRSPFDALCPSCAHNRVNLGTRDIQTSFLGEQGRDQP